MGFNHKHLDIVAHEEERPGVEGNNVVPYASATNSVIADSSVSLVSYRTDPTNSELVVETENHQQDKALSKKGEINYGFVNSESETETPFRKINGGELVAKTVNASPAEDASSETIRRNCLKDIRLHLLKDIPSEKIREDSFVKLFRKTVRTSSCLQSSYLATPCENLEAFS